MERVCVLTSITPKTLKNVLTAALCGTVHKESEIGDGYFSLGIKHFDIALGHMKTTFKFRFIVTLINIRSQTYINQIILHNLS